MATFQVVEAQAPLRSVARRARCYCITVVIQNRRPRSINERGSLMARECSVLHCWDREGRVFQDQSGRREPCADATVLAEIRHFRQTCERTGFHTCSTFGAIPEMSVPDGFRARPKPKMITRTRIQHLALSFWTPCATERPRQLQQHFVVSTSEAERRCGTFQLVMSCAQLCSPHRFGRANEFASPPSWL